MELLRLYLCGEEINTAAEEEEDEGTVSVKSFETCVMAQDAQVPVMAQQSDGHDADDKLGGSDDPLPGEQSQVVAPMEPARTDEAATLIQSAFRGFMV